MRQLREALAHLQIPLDDAMERRFDRYMAGILEWNEKINLTAITEEQAFVEKHFVDSLLCFHFPEYRQATRVLDLGTGAGFPGIPLAIVSPDKSFVLADALNKRLRVIQTVADACGISNVTLVHRRAEELGRDPAYRQSFDLCVSRAVANLAVLAEYCLPLVRRGGAFLAYKGDAVSQELASAQRAIRLLGGRLTRVQPVAVNGYDHQIVVIEKVQDTPAKYPRKAGTPAKAPIL